MADRAVLLRCVERLREVRDDIERTNEPFDAALGQIHVNLSALVLDLRSLPVTGTDARDRAASTR